MANHWLIVADQANARVFSVGKPRSRLKELALIEHPAGRLRTQRFDADRPGRAFQTTGNKRHALQRKVDPRTQQAMIFARAIADQIERARLSGDLDRFALVAPPKFLGMLRGALGAAAREALEGQFALNLTALKADEIRARLPEKLFRLL